MTLKEQRLVELNGQFGVAKIQGKSTGSPPSLARGDPIYDLPGMFRHSQC